MQEALRAGKQVAHLCAQFAVGGPARAHRVFAEEDFGYLAVRSLEGLPLSLPETTGVPRPMPGGQLHKRG